MGSFGDLGQNVPAIALNHNHIHRRHPAMGLGMRKRRRKRHAVIDIVMKLQSCKKNVQKCNEIHFTPDESI